MNNDIVNNDDVGDVNLAGMRMSVLGGDMVTASTVTDFRKQEIKY